MPAPRRHFGQPVFAPPRRRCKALRILAASAALAALATTPAWAQASPAPHLSYVTPIPLHSGVNTLPDFAPGGRTGMVVMGWRDNGNAWGFDLAMVLIQGGKGGPWNVARVEGDPAHLDERGDDVIRDVPHTGEDMVEAFRFAHGDVNGHPATLLLTATRETGSNPFPDPAPVTFRVYRLDHDPEMGTTPDHFSLILTTHAAKPSSNADNAMACAFGFKSRGFGPPGC